MGTRRNQIKEFGATGTVSELSGSGGGNIAHHSLSLFLPKGDEGGGEEGGSGSSTGFAGARGAEAWSRF